MLCAGKYKGRRFDDVAALDRGYCAWVLREKAVPLNSFYRYLVRAHGGILQVGKHKGRFFDEVLAEAPDYCEWALCLTDPSDTLQLFIDYVRVHRQAEPPVKKAKRDEKVCVICFEGAIDAAFVPCGHLVCCLACARKFDGRACPICKQLVEMVLKTYSA